MSAAQEVERVKRILLEMLIYADLIYEDQEPPYFDGKKWISGTALAERVARLIVDPQMDKELSE